MAKYMVQKMSSGTLKAITYYRKQTQDHPSHDESGRFTQDAQAYAGEWPAGQAPEPAAKRAWIVGSGIRTRRSTIPQ